MEVLVKRLESPTTQTTNILNIVASAAGVHETRLPGLGKLLEEYMLTKLQEGCELGTKCLLTMSATGIALTCQSW